MTGKCKETLEASVGETCLEFGLWPHLAICFIKSPAFGHTWVWGSAGTFSSHLQYAILFARLRGCWAFCLLLKCHDSAKLKRQETELDGSLVWSQEKNPLLWLLSEAGDCWRLGGGGRRQSQKRPGDEYSLCFQPCLLLPHATCISARLSCSCKPLAHLHTYPAPAC